MAKRTAEIARDTKNLISAITRFDAKEENFELCLNFAQSNIKYHRFLSPDSHKVETAIKGLCEKFEVHSQPKKAESLRELVDTFLDQPGLDGKEVGKTDVHYAVLSLLLELANSPTNVPYEKKVKAVVKEEVVDTFDWAGYLLDAEDLNLISYASSDSGEEEEESSEDGVSVDHETELARGAEDGSREVSRTDGGSDQAQVSTRCVSQDLGSLLDGDETGRMEDMLVVRYWEGLSVEESSAGDHVSSNLSRDWNSHKKQMNQFERPTATVVVTEYQVIRETLWILSGIADSFIFKHSGNEFSLNPTVYLMHMTQENLESCLRPFMKKANQVQTLATFVSEVVYQHHPASLDGTPHSIAQTYQAFACCVHKFLADFNHFLTGVEKEAMKQDKVLTLDVLSSRLHPWLNKLQAVHGVFINGVAQAAIGTEPSNNCIKATSLLDTLYDAVFESDLISGVDGDAQAQLLFQMLVASSEPLLRIASDWVNYGQLVDPAREFVLYRNKEITTLDETFWEKAFVSQMSHEDTDTTTAASTSDPRAPSKMTTSSVSSQVNSHSVHYQSQKSFCSDQAVYPKFLRSILGQVILTGKSMEMLENLGRMGEAFEIGSNVFERPLSLYTHFLRGMKAKLGMSGSTSLHLDSQRVSTEAKVILDKPVKQPPNLIDKQLLLKGDNDTLLHINFSALYTSSDKGCGRAKETEENIVQSPAGVPLSQGLCVCEDVLTPYVVSRYSRVCSHLLHILKSEYHLVQCIHAMQRYFLMSSGEIMYDFYTPVFHKIQAREPWREPEILEMYLHEAVEICFPEDTNRLTVCVVPLSREQTEHAINATDCIQLKYQVPWPVDVVISSSCQSQYNDIFNFLLQIKRSKFSLEQLRFEELSQSKLDLEAENSLFRDQGLGEAEEMPLEKRLHRFQLLKFRLLYFVNSLHNYMMTRILHSSGLEFSEDLSLATDLDQVIKIHHNYVRVIHDRCLLVPKLAFLKKTICQVLNLSLMCCAQWRQGISMISGEAVISLEQELSRCIQFLASFLNNVIKRGSFPHLESLAFALVTSLQNIQSH